MVAGAVVLLAIFVVVFALGAMLADIETKHTAKRRKKFEMKNNHKRIE